MLLACSHVVLASDDVPRITRFFSEAFGIAPRFENDMFSEFVLPSKFRVAFFKPTGPSARVFRSAADRTAAALGVTVDDIDRVHATIAAMGGGMFELSGPPKDHPWGERSFLLTDPDGNRWEVAQAPSAGGMLEDR
jgi:predicted enzyme related to lactoylglutathione lyase